jgi:hypothetical protein
MPKEVGDMLPDLQNDNVRRIMVKMLEDDQLDKDDKGRYVVAVNTVNEGDPDVHSEKDDTEAESGPTVNGVNGVNGTPGGVPAEVIAGAEIVEGEL